MMLLLMLTIWRWEVFNWFQHPGNRDIIWLQGVNVTVHEGLLSYRQRKRQLESQFWGQGLYM
jgi:hypothetical protein